MVVIIPNPNDQLALVKIQEKLCTQYGNSASYICKAFPLWISVPGKSARNLKELKDFSRTIKSVTIFPPQETFSCPVKITTDSEEIHTTLELLRSSGLKKIDPQSFAPVSLKIFRAGIKVQKTQNTVSIKDSVWVKLQTTSLPKHHAPEQ